MVSVCIWLCYSNTDGPCEPAFERGNIAIGRLDQDVWARRPSQPKCLDQAF